MKALLIASAALAMLAAPAAAQTGWRTVGYKVVGAGTDRDTIRVRGDARYRQIRLCSINQPIRMVDFDVIFANGGQQDVQVRNRIGAGGCTRAIDLKGNRRNIERVALTYGKLQRNMRPPLVRVQVR